MKVRESVILLRFNNEILFWWRFLKARVLILSASEYIVFFMGLAGGWVVGRIIKDVPSARLINHYYTVP